MAVHNPTMELLERFFVPLITLNTKDLLENPAFLEKFWYEKLGTSDFFSS
jgi:hypothetical protein